MHIPVLLQEVLRYLSPRSGENFIDGTIGEGGHALEILKHTAPDGKLLGIDWDLHSLEHLIPHIPVDVMKRLILVNDTFANLKRVIAAKKFSPVHGIILDLGLSSWQLEESKGGFSFLRDEPLDMRLARETNGYSGPTAAEIINDYSREKLERILREYGEEPHARQIVKVIVEARRRQRLVSSGELARIIVGAVPRRRHQRIHPATKTFQALRIAVNDELENLKKVLADGCELLVPGGRIVVISFHSLEDRIVKNVFREHQKAGYLSLLTKKPITPSGLEINSNLRSRSAKLRAALKI